MTTIVGLHSKKGNEEGIVLASDRLHTNLSINSPDEVATYMGPKLFVSEDNNYAFSPTGQMPFDISTIMLFDTIIDTKRYNLNKIRNIRDICEHIEREVNWGFTPLERSIFNVNIIFATRFNGELNLYEVLLKPDKTTTDYKANKIIPRKIYTSFQGSGKELAYEASIFPQIAKEKIKKLRENNKKLEEIASQYSMTELETSNNPIHKKVIKYITEYNNLNNNLKYGTIKDNPLDMTIKEAQLEVINAIDRSQWDWYTKGISMVTITNEGIKNIINSREPIQKTEWKLYQSAIDKLNRQYNFEELNRLRYNISFYNILKI